MLFFGTQECAFPDIGEALPSLYMCHRQPVPLFIQIRPPSERGPMFISRIIVGLLWLTLPLALVGQSETLGSSIASTAAADQAKDAPKLERFDPNLVDKTLSPCDDF